MTIAADKTCETCRFWIEIPTESALGQCRRSAPRATAQHLDWRLKRVTACWPETGNYDWCGEYKKGEV